MTPPAHDDMLLTLPQVCQVFTVKPSLVRSWVEHEKLRPVKRGSEKGSPLYFARGDVAALLHGLCRLCGESFKRANQRQEFCGQSCRQKYSRRAKG